MTPLADGTRYGWRRREQQPWPVGGHKVRRVRAHIERDREEGSTGGGERKKEEQRRYKEARGGVKAGEMTE